MTFFIAGPACALHGLRGVLLLQLHPQPHLVHNPLKALPQGILGHIWKVLGLPGLTFSFDPILGPTLLQKFPEAKIYAIAEHNDETNCSAGSKSIRYKLSDCRK